MTITFTKTKVALAIVVAALLVPATAYATHVFDDVPDDKFYAGPVEWAFDNDITTGKSPTSFAPEDNVTRGESVTFLKRYNDNIVEPADTALQADIDNLTAQTYTQAEVDALLADKADTADIPATTVASAERNASLTLTTGNQTAVNTDIATAGPATLLVSAAIEADGDGGNDDNMNCNIDVDGTDGLRQSVSLDANTLDNAAVVTLSQAFPVAAGTHTVIVECNEGLGSGTFVESASLVVLAVD
ncbi:MAG: S-layer homology domain-containing protein [Acidimicrobiales bacterium]